jgi:hypothetical protein
MSLSQTVIGCPVAASLDGWTRHEWNDGLQLDSLHELDEVSIQTRNNLYRIIVIAPRGGEVLVQGGRFFPEPTRARFAGCSLGGAFLKQRGVYVGYRLEIHIGLERIVTSHVRSIEVVSSRVAH